MTDDMPLANNDGLDAPVQTRIGIAKLTAMAFKGGDLGMLWNDLLEEVAQDSSNTAAVMDMLVIAQLLGDQESGLALQDGALTIERLYRSPCAAEPPALRVLALAAATDIGGNTPVEFLLEESDIELCTLYVVPGMPLPESLPEHDVAFVIVPGSESTRATLAEVETLVRAWPRPVLNRPQSIAHLDRDRLYRLLQGIGGIDMPATVRISRDQLIAISEGRARVEDHLSDGRFPLIVRPLNSHAGRGLEKLDGPADIGAYLAAREEADFFISRYVDYRSADGQFRKYRVVLADGRPYPWHMAISDQWKIWYLNAEMAESPDKRAEEEHFMVHFADGFAARHRAALDEIVHRLGLDYFAIDCAETPAGDLLIFEADNSMIVHNMDPADIFPYKAPHMRQIFDAVAAMLKKAAGRKAAP